ERAAQFFVILVQLFYFLFEIGARLADPLHVAVVLFERNQPLEVTLERLGRESQAGQLAREIVVAILPIEHGPQGIDDVHEDFMLSQYLRRNRCVAHANDSEASTLWDGQRLSSRQFYCTDSVGRR